MTDKKNERIKNTMCFVPFFSIVIYFLEKDKSERMNKNIIYSIILLVFFILFWLITEFFLGFIFYILFSVYFGYKAYIWEDIDVKFLDDLFIKKK